MFLPIRFVKLTAGSATANIALPTDTVGLMALEITPTTGDGIFANFGGSTVQAAEPDGTFDTSGGVFVATGQSKLINVPKGATHMAYIRLGATDVVFYVAETPAIP